MVAVGPGEISQIAVCPSCNTKSPQKCKEEQSCTLSENYIRWFYRHRTKISKLREVRDLGPNQCEVQRAEHRSTCCWFMQIRQCCQCCKNQTNSSYPSKFVRNTTENCVDPLEVPLGNDVRRGRIRVCRDIIIRMSQSFWIERHLKSSPHSLSLCSTQIFRIEVRVKIDHVCMCANPLRISRSILMLGRKVNQALCCQQKWEQVVEAIKTIQSWIIHSKSSP